MSRISAWGIPKWNEKFIRKKCSESQTGSILTHVIRGPRRTRGAFWYMVVVFVVLVNEVDSSRVILIQ